MEYVNSILIIIGFIIIGYYQRQKIGALEKQLISQKELIGSTKAFFDLFDLEKLKGYGDVVEKKVRTEMECQVASLKTDFDKEKSKVGEKLMMLWNEFNVSIRALGLALVYLSTDDRTRIIDRMEEGIAKRILVQLSKEVDDIVVEARTAAFKTFTERRNPT